MRYEIIRNEVHVPGPVEKALLHKIEKVQERLKRYHPEAADLEIRLRHHAKLNEFDCTLKLKAFKEQLNAKKAAPDLRTAIDRTFDAMMKELDHYRLKINKSLQSSS